MKASELKKTINVALYIIEEVDGISVSRLRTYLLYLDYLGLIKYPASLDEVFFKKLVDSKYVTYIFRRNSDIDMVSGLYVDEKGKINYNFFDTNKIGQVINKFKTVPYLKLLEETVPVGSKAR